MLFTSFERLWILNHKVNRWAKIAVDLSQQSRRQSLMTSAVNDMSKVIAGWVTQHNKIAFATISPMRTSITEIS